MWHFGQGRRALWRATNAHCALYICLRGHTHTQNHTHNPIHMQRPHTDKPTHSYTRALKTPHMHSLNFTPHTHTHTHTFLLLPFLIHTQYIGHWLPGCVVLSTSICEHCDVWFNWNLNQHFEHSVAITVGHTNDKDNYWKHCWQLFY